MQKYTYKKSDFCPSKKGKSCKFVHNFGKFSFDNKQAHPILLIIFFSFLISPFCNAAEHDKRGFASFKAKWKYFTLSDHKLVPISACTIIARYFIVCQFVNERCTGGIVETQNGSETQIGFLY